MQDTMPPFISIGLAISVALSVLGLLLMSWDRIVRWFRHWRVARAMARWESHERDVSEAARDEIEASRARIYERRRRAHAAHPTIHRWDNKRGRDGGEAA